MNLTSFTGYVIDVEIKWFPWDKIILLTTLSWDRPDLSSPILLWAVVEIGPFKLGSLFYTYQVSQLICSSMIWTQHWPEVAEVGWLFCEVQNKERMWDPSAVLEHISVSVSCHLGFFLNLGLVLFWNSATPTFNTNPSVIGLISETFISIPEENTILQNSTIYSRIALLQKNASM